MFYMDSRVFSRSVRHPAPLVYGLGQCALDYLGTVEAYPRPDVKCEFSGLLIQGGGPVATALVALSRWGLTCAFAGVTGDDLFGEMIRASLDEEGVDTGGLLVRKGFESQFAFIVAEPAKGGRRTIFWQRPTGPPPIPDELDYGLIRQARVVLTDGLFPDAALAACKAAREAGVPVVVDAGSLREGMLDLARVSDFYLASETFAKAFAGNATSPEACKKLAELGPKVTGVTLGAKGYVAWTADRMIDRPAYKVNAVDSTAAGDVFTGSLSVALAEGKELTDAVKFANAAAALSVTKLGAQPSAPTRKEIEEFIKNN